MIIPASLSALFVAALLPAQSTQKPLAAWKSARAAHASAANATTQTALFRAFLAFDRGGLLNVGTPEKAVLATLGKPDRSDMVAGKASGVTRHHFAFLAITCRQGKVLSVVDTRRMPASTGSERLSFQPSDKRAWRPGHRFANRQRFVTEFVLPGERVQAWTQLVTQERYLGLAPRVTPQSFVTNIRKQLVALDADCRWEVHAQTKGKIVYEWVIHAKDAARAQRELATLVFGARDVHRLAFASKGAKLDAGLRAKWLETMKRARVGGAASSRPSATRAQPAATKRSPITRRLAWELGSKLSLATILAAKGADAKLVKGRLAMAQTMARGLGVTIPPLPVFEGESSARYARGLAYMMKGMGPVADALRSKYDRQHSLLMSIAIKSNASFLIYNPKDETGQTIAARAEKVCSELALPDELWRPAVECIRSRKTFAQVKAAIFKMHRDVSAYLSPRRK